MKHVKRPLFHLVVFRLASRMRIAAAIPAAPADPRAAVFPMEEKAYPE